MPSAKKNKIARNVRLRLLLVCMIGLMQLPLLAVQSLTLAWDASSSTNVLGYRVYYGTTSHQYSSAVSVGTATTATIAGLVEGMTYYFSVTAYDVSNVESLFSDEAAVTVPLNLTNNPAKVPCGTVAAGQNVTISLPASVSGTLSYQWMFNGNNIASATNAVLTLNNLAASQAGAYSVTVTGASGSTNSTATSLMIYSTGAATLTQAAYAGGQFTCNVSGIPGSQYVVQASTNQTTWVSVQTNASPFIFTDSSAGQFSQRFYRAFNYANSVSNNSVGVKVFLAAATLTQAAYANGQYSFNISGVSGNQYVVQASTNMVDWVSVQTNTVPFIFTDTNAGQYSQRFYRTYWKQSP